MTTLAIQAGPFRFLAVLEEDACPRTCAMVREGLPFDGPLLHGAWSGEVLEAPLEGLDLRLPWEAPTVHPTPGTFLLRPGGSGALAGPALMVAYGPAMLSGRPGPLPANPFATLLSGLDKLAELGRLALREGAQPLRIALA